MSDEELNQILESIVNGAEVGPITTYALAAEVKRLRASLAEQPNKIAARLESEARKPKQSIFPGSERCDGRAEGISMGLDAAAILVRRWARDDCL